MLLFIKKFFIDGFMEGDYTYGITHVISFILLIASMIVFTILLKNKTAAYIHKRMKILAILVLTVYMIRRTISFFHDTSFLVAYWPFYLCNINTICLSLYIIFDWKWGKDFVIVTGFIGGVITFLIPDGIFNDPYLTFPILDSILSHYILVVIPFVLVITKAHRLHIKNMYIPIIGLLITVFNAEVLQKILVGTNYDYLFFHDTIPFTIPNIPQFLIISTLMISVIAGIYLASEILINKSLFQKSKKES